LARWLTVLFGALAAVTLAVPGADAHPFGPPPVLELSHEDSTVHARYTVAYDDMLAVGEHLGLLEEGTTAAYLDPVSRQMPLPPDVQAVYDAEAFAAYFSDGIALSQDGRACPGEIREVDQVARDGMRATFDCPDEVGEVEVEVTALSDLSSAYTTVVFRTGEACLRAHACPGRFRRPAPPAGGASAWSLS
jgi:hypothetical protein